MEKKASRVLETCITSFLEIINGEEEADTDVNFIAVASKAKSDLDRSAGESFHQREKYTTRLSELRNVLLVVRTSGDEEGGENGCPETTEKANAAKNLIKPLFAELLLRCRELVREEETALMDELDEAQREAKEARVAVFKALREQEEDFVEGGERRRGGSDEAANPMPTRFARR